MQTKTPRPKGSGGIGYRADRRRWYYRWSEHGVPKVGYAITEADALARLAEATTARDKGRRMVTRRYRLATFLPLWHDALTGISSGSRIKYRYAMQAWIDDPIGQIKLADLDSLMIRKTLARWKGAGVSAAAIRMRLTILAMALDVARLDGHIADNVARPPYVKAPKVPMRDVTLPDAETMDALRREIGRSPWEAAFLLALDAGLRQGEILALRWRHVTISERSYVAVEGTLAYGTDDVGRPKTRHSRREIEISDRVRDALIRHRDRSRIDQDPDGFVFMYRAPADGPQHGLRAADHVMRGNLLSKYWRAMCRAAAGCDCAGIPSSACAHTWRFHDLRHAFITAQIQAGVPIALLSRYVGHANIDMTVDRYGHMRLAAPR